MAKLLTFTIDFAILHAYLVELSPYHRSPLSWHHLGERRSQNIFWGTAFPRVPRSPSTTPLATAFILNPKITISLRCPRDLLRNLNIWRALVTPIFSVAPSGETMRQTPNVLKEQERARGPLSQCQVWWGSNFTRRRGGENVEFFVCQSRFWMSEFVCPISPWRRWNTEMVLMLLDRGKFVVVHSCSTYSDCRQLSISHH